MIQPHQSPQVGPRRKPIDRLALLLGQWWGTGLSPVAPGTVGSLGALPLFFLIRDTHNWLYWLVTLSVSTLGIWASQRCSELLAEKDPQSVVIDEVAGVLIALGVVRTAGLPLLILAWLLFRLLDITKPWLIDRAQYLRPSGLGIMADDLLAGLVSGLSCLTFLAVHAAL